MSKRILVIDDEQSVRDAFELALEDQGYLIDTVDSSSDGLTRAQQTRPDLIFLDLRMPGMDGIETLRRLHKCCPDVPVFVVTAFYQQFIAPLKQATEEGLRFELARKPLSGDQIRAITASLFDKP